MPRYNAWMVVRALQPLGQFYAPDEESAIKEAMRLSRGESVMASALLEEITFEDVEVEED